MIKQILKTRDPDSMSNLKKGLDEITDKVEQSEGLVSKLENELVEWNSFQKLCKRDIELEEIQELLTDFKKDLDEVVAELNDHHQKKLEEKESKGESIELNYMLEAIESYKNDTNELTQEVEEIW